VRILVVNDFVRNGSGTDACVRLELAALGERGHDARLLAFDNHALDEATTLQRAALLASTVYSLPAYRAIDRVLARRRVDAVHLHNLVPFITSAAYDACRRRGVATVQHLHNYRAFCLSSYAYSDGAACDACTGTAFLAGVRDRCYRGSLAASAGLAAARGVDWARGLFGCAGADLYVAVSEHVARRHIEHGLPAERLRVLHDPAEDLAALLPAPAPAGAAKKLCFVGSLLAAKGVWPALELAAALPDFELHLLGSGDEEAALRAAARRRGLGNVVFHGHLQGAARAAAWADSFLTLVPSLWEEPFGLVVPESYSLSVPVLATAAGGLAEIVREGVTGLRLHTADPGDGAAQVRALWADAARYAGMRGASRQTYERRFTPSVFAAKLETQLAEAAAQPAASPTPRPWRRRSTPA
jgi:glycosyltransferase involved in cell wall biosynthesis